MPPLTCMQVRWNKFPKPCQFCNVASGRARTTWAGRVLPWKRRSKESQSITEEGMSSPFVTPALLVWEPLIDSCYGLIMCRLCGKSYKVRRSGSDVKRHKLRIGTRKALGSGLLVKGFVHEKCVSCGYGWWTWHPRLCVADCVWLW